AIDADFGANLFGQRLDPLAQRVALVGESHFGALVSDSPCNAPGDRTVVRDTHHEAALSGHKSLRIIHYYSPCARWRHPTRKAASGKEAGMNTRVIRRRGYRRPRALPPAEPAGPRGRPSGAATDR